MSFLTGRCKETTVGLPEKQRIEKVFFETMPSDKACEAFTGFFWLIRSLIMIDWLMDVGMMFDRVCVSTVCRGLSFLRVSCNTGFQTSTVLPPVKVVQLAWKGKVSPRIWPQKNIPVVLVFRVSFNVHLKPCPGCSMPPWSESLFRSSQVIHGRTHTRWKWGCVKQLIGEDCGSEAGDATCLIESVLSRGAGQIETSFC